MNEIVPIRMSTEDKAKLQEKAKQNRLKLSSYLRHELTKTYPMSKYYTRLSNSHPGDKLYTT